jgi:pimeloyl-ACP methyl ester carboxylesterase
MTRHHRCGIIYFVDTPASPVETLLFAQHGWADTNRSMVRFGAAISAPGTLVIAPNLGYVRTWLRIEPLIASVEQVAIEVLEQHPEARIRAVGHSMGGLIWVELLTRHPEWLARTDRLVLVGCPIGGADLARLFDPLGLTIGRDLQVDRRALAEAVASTVPTLSIVGDLLGPHDGTISHDSARFQNARFVLAPSSSHAGLRRSRWVTLLTRAFFERGSLPSVDLAAIAEQIAVVPGINLAEPQMFRFARVAGMFADGSTIRRFDVVPGFELVFLADGEGRCVFAGGVSWSGRRALRQILQEIQQQQQALLLHPTPTDEP